MIEPTAQAFSVTLLALVFLAAGLSKLRALEAFEGVVHNFRLLPEAAVRPVTYALPVSEFGVAALVLLPALRAYGGWGAAGLLVVFTAAVAINLLRGRREIDCGCFSSELKQSLSWWLVARNLALLALALWLAGGPAAAQPIGRLEWFIGSVAALVAAVLYAAGLLLSTAAQHAEQHRRANRIAPDTGTGTEGLGRHE